MSGWMLLRSDAAWGGALATRVFGRQESLGRAAQPGRAAGWLVGVCVCVHTHQHRTGSGAFCGDNKLAGLRPAVSKGDVSLLGCLRPTNLLPEKLNCFFFFPPRRFLDVPTAAMAPTSESSDC